MTAADRGDGTALSALSRWQAQGLSVRLATVVQSYGSAPYEAGTLYALNAQGQEAGTLAGICLGSWLKTRTGRIKERRVAVIAAGSADGLDLPCAGRLEFLIEDNPESDRVREWHTAPGTRTCVRRTIDTAGGRPLLATASAREC